MAQSWQLQRDSVRKCRESRRNKRQNKSSSTPLLLMDGARSGSRADNCGSCTPDGREMPLPFLGRLGFLSHLRNLDIQPSHILPASLRRHSCIGICVHNAKRLSRLMKVEHARATVIARTGCAKRAPWLSPARRKLAKHRGREDAGLPRF